MAPAIVTLTTDFGLSSGYVGAMKGVVLGIDADVTLVDISHDIPPQDIPHAAFVLGASYRYFPPEVVHVAVVDPQVGTERRPLLVDTPGGRFIAPDNGLLTYVLLDLAGRTRPDGDGEGFLAPTSVPVPEGCSAYALTQPEYWRHPVSDTFHGRDIFAPVAAHLCRGVRPEEMGEAVGEVTTLDVRTVERRPGVVEGRIVFVDHFGNLVSNIRTGDDNAADMEVDIRGRRIEGLKRTFAEGRGLLALVGSHGYLEVAERNGSAADRLEAGVGTRVRLVRRSEAGAGS
jgi:S-adenosylmethionine hydrolase